MNLAACPRCTVRPRIPGFAYCSECAAEMLQRYRAVAKRDQRLAEFDPRGGDYAPAKD